MSTIKVTNINNASASSGGIALDSSGHVQVDGVQMPTAGALSSRNRIINGSMAVAQRGTSYTGNGFGSLDRWYVNQSGGSTTFSQETFAVGSELEGLKNYAKLAVSTSSDYTGIRQYIEDVRSIPAGTITVSFWAKGTNPSGNLAVRPLQNFGSTGSASVDIATQTVTLTSSWQRFELQFTVPSISGKTVDEADSRFGLNIGQGTDTGTTAWELNITGVQLEVGEKATPFEHRSYGDELARCQRYYEAYYLQSYAFVGNSYSSTQAIVPLHWNVQKRAIPTMTLPPVGINSGEVALTASNASYATTRGTHTLNGRSPSYGELSANSYGGLTSGGICMLYAAGTTCFLTLDAEL